MDELNVGNGHKLGFSKAKRGAKCWVGPSEFAIESDDREHVLRECEGTVDFVPCALAFHDATECRADACHYFEQRFVRLLEFIREELEDGCDVIPHSNREREGGCQAGGAPGFPTHKAVVP